MEHVHPSDHNHHRDTTTYNYTPLIVSFGIVMLWTVLRFIYFGEENMQEVMQDFMGGFFVVFGLLKILGYKGFIETFPRYDIVAKKIKLYAYLYPFIEFKLGILFILGLYPLATNIFTLLIMVVGSIGIYRTLKKGVFIQCACLGGLFALPLSWISFGENILMAVMSLTMLLQLI